MKRLLTLTAFPLIGCAWLAVAVLLSWAQLRLRIVGTKTPGRVAGMAIVRPGACDLVTALDATLTLTLANGERLRVAYRDYAPVSAQFLARRGAAARPIPLAELDAGTTTNAGTLTRELRRALYDAVRGDAAIIRWILQREARNPNDATRIVRLTKTETAHGFFDMPDLAPTLVGEPDGIRPVDPRGTLPPRATVVTRAVFDASDPLAVQTNKGDSMCAFVQLRGTVTNDVDKRNFILFCEPYASEFRPVFAYTVGTQQYVRLSHVGRHGGPTLAIVLFGPCWVYYDPLQPATAVLIADPGAADGAWLAWFSRLCEGAFSQWGSSALIVLAGLTFILIGLIQLSLVIRPSTNLVQQ